MTFLYKPATRDRKIRSIKREIPNPTRNRTLEHVTQGWVPVNTALLSLIKTKVSEDQYVDKPAQLLEDIKADPALLLHFVKNAPRVIDSPHALDNPLHALRSATTEQLSELLNFSTKGFSVHQLEQASKLQASRTQSALLSSHAASAIAEKFNLDSDSTHTVALFRQLGHDLIAWNYPSIYSRAMSKHRRQGVEVDLELKKIIGLTPIELGSRFAADWGLSKHFVRSIDEQPATYASEDSTEGQMSVAALCEMTELYAKSRDPENFPSAGALWKSKESSITNIIGEDTLSQVEEDVQSTMTVLSMSNTALKNTPLIDKGSKYNKKKKKASTLLSKNQYAQDLPPEIRALLESVYQELEDSRVPIEAMKFLSDQVIPSSGFTRGCLFLLDKTTHDLAPSIRYGDAGLNDYISIMNDPEVGVGTALYSNAPIKQVWRGVAGSRTPQICGSLRNFDHPGVLYLEILPAAYDDPDYDALAHFHAIRQAINHCFGGS